MVNIDKIKALTREKGLKLKYVCAQIGVAETYLGHVKNGKDRMTDERLEKIAEILETTTAYLCDETDIKEKPDADKGDELVRLSVIEKTILERVHLVPEERREELIALIETTLKMNGLL